MLHLLALTWNPGIRGVLDVAVAVTVLCGTPLLLLITNNGARLGFHLAVTGLFGWLTLMFLFWVIFGIGYKGPAPSWKVIEVNLDTQNALHSVARSVPDPASLPTAESFVKSSKLVAEAVKGSPKAPTLGDAVSADPTVEKLLAAKLNGWRLVGTSDPISGDAGATATGYLTTKGYNGSPLTSQQFVLGNIYDRGGKPRRTNDSLAGRVGYRLEKLGMWFAMDNPTHYAVVQAHLTIPQTALPGAALPTPQIDPNQPTINLVMVRDNGAVRGPATALFFFALTVFAILAYQLHRRDRVAMAARAAAAADLAQGV